MIRHNDHVGLRAATVLAVLTALAVSALSGQSGSLARARGLSPLRSTALECEGGACSQVTLTFDEQRQQYAAQNNSSDRWVRVTASNYSAAAAACAAPGRSVALTLKSIVGAYRAEFDEPGCGATGGE
jgi:hypothetical protein